MLLLRFSASASSTASSRLAMLPRGALAAAGALSASSCVSSFRAAGPHARPSSDGLSLIAYAEQCPAYAKARQSFPRSRRSLVERRRTAAAPGERKMRIPDRESAPGRPRRTQAARGKLEAGSERKMESIHADNHKCAGSKAAAVETAAWLHRVVSVAL